MFPDRDMILRDGPDADEWIGTLQVGRANGEQDHRILEKFLEADPFTQENILETVSFACNFEVYRKKFANNEKVIEMMLSQM